MSPQREAKNPTVIVYDILKTAMTMKAALNAVSAKYIGGIFLFCALFSIFSLIIIDVVTNYLIFISLLTFQRSHYQQMNDLFGIRCFFCQNIPTQFSMLTCSHIICGECMGSLTESRSLVTSIECPCGLVTSIPKQQHNRQSSFLRPFTSLNKNHSQIFDQSQFLITDTYARSSQKTSKISNIKRKLDEKKGNLNNYLSVQLNNEIKFMELRFKRYLNEINRCYKRLVVELHRNYGEFVQSVVMQCKLKIEANEIKCLSTIQNYVEKAFKPQFEKNLSKISKYLSDLIAEKPDSQCQQRNITQKQNICINLNNVQTRLHTNKQSHHKCGPRSRSRSRSRSGKNRVSTHDTCKYEKQSDFISKLKSATVKNSKIRRKRVQNTRFSHHKLIL